MSSQDTELKVAVLGVGKMGSFHVESLSRRTRGARTSRPTASPTRSALVSSPTRSRRSPPTTSTPS